MRQSPAKLPMNKQARITEIVEKLSGKPGIDREESLVESEIRNSFALTDMVGALEREFSVHIPESDPTRLKFESVSRIAAYIESHC
jgi:acyl carrier protein